MPFTRVDKIVAADSVREQIFEMIKSGELKLGDRLPSEMELSAAFGVSRPVVREALGSLRALGLIQSQAGRGARVTAIRPPLILGDYSVENLHQVRCFLEIPTARLAAERCADGASSERLESILRELLECEDRHQWVELDAEFHHSLAKLAGNHLLIELLEHILASVRELSYSLSMRRRVLGANKEHERIVSAVVAGDGRAAQEAMRSHLLAVQTSVTSFFGEEEWTRTPLVAQH